MSTTLDAPALDPELLADPLTVGSSGVGAPPPHLCFDTPQVGISEPPGNLVDVEHVFQHGGHTVGRMHRVPKLGGVFCLKEPRVILHEFDVFFCHHLPLGIRHEPRGVRLPLAKHGPE